jgi:tetratricopeptide (TPR) repeat protein
MTSRPYEVARLDEIERDGSRSEWIPIRRHLGISAFGVNAWASADKGAEIIREHEESSIGHEEFYVVLEGAATFTVDGQEVEAPAGTAIFVRDPAVRRGARTKAGGATILTVGAKPGEAFRIAPWERNAEVIPLFERGEYAEAKQLLQQLLADAPDAAGPMYNLACAEARLGEHEAALDHLARAVELHPDFADLARDDPDLAPIRDDSRFPN